MAGIEELRTTLGALEGIELKMAELYGLCAALWPADVIFWATLETDERRHASQLARIATLVETQPSQFQAGRPFKASAISTMVTYVDSLLHKLKRREMDQATLLNIARDLEKSLIESRYAEVVRTQNAEVLGMLQQIHQDTTHHHDRIDSQARQLV